MPDPLRGEIWLFEFGIGVGHEQSGRRPGLIVSVDRTNTGPSRLLTVIPITSKIAKSKTIPWHVLVQPPEGGLKAPSVILCDQLRVSSKDRLIGTVWGQFHPATMLQVEDML